MNYIYGAFFLVITGNCMAIGDASQVQQNASLGNRALCSVTFCRSFTDMRETEAYYLSCLQAKKILNEAAQEPYLISLLAITYKHSGNSAPKKYDNDMLPQEALVALNTFLEEIEL